VHLWIREDKIIARMIPKCSGLQYGEDTAILFAKLRLKISQSEGSVENVQYSQP